MVQLVTEPLAPASRPINGSEFSAVVAAVTSTFGDPTRRQVYLHVSDSSRRGDRVAGGTAILAPPQRGSPPPGQAGRQVGTSRCSVPGLRTLEPGLPVPGDLQSSTAPVGRPRSLKPPAGERSSS